MAQYSWNLELIADGPMPDAVKIMGAAMEALVKSRPPGTSTSIALAVAVQQPEGGTKETLRVEG